MSKGLILPNRSTKYLSLSRIIRSALKRRITKVQGFPGEENTAPHSSLQNRFETGAFYADQGGRRDTIRVEEDFISVDGTGSHLFALAEDKNGLGPIERDEEEGECLAGFGDRVASEVYARRTMVLEIGTGYPTWSRLATRYEMWWW